MKTRLRKIFNLALKMSLLTSVTISNCHHYLKGLSLPYAFSSYLYSMLGKVSSVNWWLVVLSSDRKFNSNNEISEREASLKVFVIDCL